MAMSERGPVAGPYARVVVTSDNPQVTLVFERMVLPRGLVFASNLGLLA